MSDQAIVPFTHHSHIAVHDACFSKEDIDATMKFARAAKAKNTLLAYRSDWRHFSTWAEKRGAIALPCTPALLSVYIAFMAGEQGLSVSSIQRHIAAVSYVHRQAGHDTPAGNAAVREVMHGIKNTIGTLPRRQKDPLIAPMIVKMLAACPDTTIGIRDAAMIAVAFSCAMRRSELIGLDVEDLQEKDDGLLVTIRKSKTDQEGRGQQIAVPFGIHIRPVELLQRWLTHAEISTGPIFRRVDRGGNISQHRIGDDAWVRRLKKYCRVAGLDPATFSGHSCRSGFLTSASEAGADALKMSEVSRHKSLDVLKRYVRRSNLFKGHAGSAFL